jgi:hypothetical protein
MSSEPEDEENMPPCPSLIPAVVPEYKPMTGLTGGTGNGAPVQLTRVAVVFGGIEIEQIGFPAESKKSTVPAPGESRSGEKN